MSRIALVLALIPLAACQMDNLPQLPGMAPPANLPDMSVPGTCFMFVEDPGDGTFTLVQGISDGSEVPVGTRARGLSAAELDARWEKERAIMQVNPECLAISVRDRTQAREVSAS
ncbi:hypothetical protein ERN12_00150 [Rhodobacteraceae bacterium]|nr:hypothetical protein ERN12_00150 [Paracoccaceae bacterium]